MDLDQGDEVERFRAECRSWLEANVPRQPLPPHDTAEGFALHREWERKLYDNRWSVVSWPEEFGGRGAGLFEWLAFEEEYYRAEAPTRIAQNGIFLLAPTIFEFGTRSQQERFLPKMASGEELWAQGWSEPDAGSDLASLKSKATKVDGGWLLNGQKTWTTRGAFCDWLFGLFRSNPDEERHRGLSYFMVDLTTKGVTVNPVGKLDGLWAFAEVFFNDVFVPDDQVLGEVDQGWSVAMATTGSERGLTLRSPGRFSAAVSRLVDLYRQTTTSDNPPPPHDGSGGFVDPTLRDRVIRAHISAEAYRWSTFGTVTQLAEGGSIGAESSINKIFWSEMDLQIHIAALDLLGPTAALTGDASAAVDAGKWLDGYLFALSGPIYAGTNEIQRNIASERVLGLPRR